MIAASVEQNILECIPHQPPFRFVDDIISIDEEHVSGSYRFKQDEVFYKGHFPGNPITPGVILTECMAQIGLVAMGVYLYGATPEIMKHLKVFFTGSDVNYYRMVLPGERVIVHSTKLFFRLKRLKCEVKMETESGELICSGILSGMFIDQREKR
ncbi:MAG: hydroxymyristoyl-ACP dehydratase [Flavobacteriales bacterium]|nr:hydroxymyristoyl-ACP dehydratase [Flavobacteriales bacterium]